MTNWSWPARRRVLPVVLVALTILEFSSLTIALAPVLAACDPARAHDNEARHVATVKGVSSSLSGVGANILEYDPYYSGLNDAGTNTTILLVKRNPTQWAQLGWMKHQIFTPGTTRRSVGLEFYVSSSDNRFQFWSGKPVGTFTYYKILYRADVDVFDFYAAGSKIAQQGYLTTPTEVQLFSETHDFGDQMPGGSGAHEIVTYAYYYTGSTFTTHWLDTAMSSGSPEYGYSDAGVGRYEMWDTKCAS